LLDINRLATVKNQIRTATQNAIIMGVEIDGYGKPVNYHMYEFMFGDDQSKWTTKPYSAENIIHLFLQDSPEQIRGVSWMHASMIRMFHLKKYQEWAIIAVKLSNTNFCACPQCMHSASASRSVPDLNKSLISDSPSIVGLE